MSTNKLFLLLGIFWFITAPVWGSPLINLENPNWKYTINPDTLAVWSLDKKFQITTQLAQPLQNLGTPAQIKQSYRDAEWYYPKLNLAVRVGMDTRGLKFDFATRTRQTLDWPAAGLSQQARALIIPDGEGLYIPSKDPFWLAEFKKFPNISLLLPFWGVQYGLNYVSYLVPDNTRTQYSVLQQNDQLFIVNHHEFLKRDNFPVYTVLIHFTGNTPISPSIDYRDWMIMHHDYISLSRKMMENPNIKKLLGAFHIWVWGDGKSMSMLSMLQRMGIDHLWIGYDATTTRSFNITQNYIQEAMRLGYLIAPYDTFQSAEDPRDADSINSIWQNNLWQEGCIRTAEDKVLEGSDTRGCSLSSQALRLREAQQKNMENRISELTRDGNNSYFLDGDAARPLYDDYSTVHPMNQIQDKINRISRMKYISDSRKLVLGSEMGDSWSSPVIAFSNGSFSTFDDAFWLILNDKEQFGGWSPQDRPDIFFKAYHAPAEFITAAYDPRYRIPLYEAALHDSVVSTDRWELNELKIPELYQIKPLLESLYNVPPIWVLDVGTLQSNGANFVNYYRFFSPLHQVAATQPLTLFKWVTPDHLVQQTQFGTVLTMTANFSEKPFEGINPRCIRATWILNNKSSVYCPQQLAQAQTLVPAGQSGAPVKKYRRHRRYRRRWNYY